MAPEGRLQLLPASEEDLEALIALRIVAMRESLERIGRFDPERARRRFASTFAAEATRHIVLDGERVGFVALKPAAEGLLLDHLYVHPDHQGRGIGGLVLRVLFAEADAAGSSIRVGALRGSGSNRFYVGHGFVQVEEAEWDIYYTRAARAEGRS